jgi:hypothetical protein
MKARPLGYIERSYESFLELPVPVVGTPLAHGGSATKFMCSGSLLVLVTPGDTRIGRIRAHMGAGGS